MNYIKIGFELAAGWHRGKTVCHITNETSAQLIKRYVHEKYWNTTHPDYPLRTKTKSNKQMKMKIGFSTD